MADVSIDGTILASTSRGMRSVVFTTALIGYWFSVDSSGEFHCLKTTDGGASWANPSFGAGTGIVNTQGDTIVGFDVWYDQWTPGDTGTKIHCWWFGTTQDIVYYVPIDTAGDTLGTERTAFTGASSVAARSAFCSGTKTRSGYLYVAFDIDGGAEHGLVRSTDGGPTWSANLSATFVIDTGAGQVDQCLCFPATGTGDDNDMWAIYQDSSAAELTMKMWDSSAAAEVESSSMGAMTINATDGTGQMGFTGAVRLSDGALIVVSMSSRDAAGSKMQVWTVTGVTAGSQTGITAKTDITTNIDDNYNPSVFIDQNTNNIYVAYNGKRDGSEVIGTTTKVYYTKSTDGATSWSAGDTAYMEGAAGVVLQVWAPISAIGGGRFYVGWRVGTTLLGNKVNSVDVTPVLIELTTEPLTPSRWSR